MGSTPSPGFSNGVSEDGVSGGIREGFSQRTQWLGGQRRAAGLIAWGLAGIFFSVRLFKAQFSGVLYSDEH